MKYKVKNKHTNKFVSKLLPISKADKLCKQLNSNDRSNKYILVNILDESYKTNRK